MSASPVIRLARFQEAVELTDLAKRSKAHWGYDADFMRQSADALTVTEQAIAQGRVWVAERNGHLMGVASIDEADEESGCDYELALMFVDPDAMGEGLGRMLFEQAVIGVRERGGETMEILSDPDAEPFYRRMGATPIGDAPSDAIPGRRLPLLKIDVKAR
ncbi:MAG: GNAT family N-acetyltransferase [Pseudomonadota bacterium]